MALNYCQKITGNGTKRFLKSIYFSMIVNFFKCFNCYPLVANVITNEICRLKVIIFGITMYCQSGSLLRKHPLGQQLGEQTLDWLLMENCCKKILLLSST